MDVQCFDEGRGQAVVRGSLVFIDYIIVYYC